MVRLVESILKLLNKKQCLETKEKEIMLNNVNFVKTDGLTPTRQGASHAYNLRVPFNVRINPQTKTEIRLGLCCDYPLHVYEVLALKRDGLNITNVGVFDAFEQIVLKVENSSSVLIAINEGETVARAHALNDVDNL